MFHTFRMEIGEHFSLITFNQFTDIDFIIFHYYADGIQIFDHIRFRNSMKSLACRMCDTEILPKRKPSEYLTVCPLVRPLQTSRFNSFECSWILSSLVDCHGEFQTYIDTPISKWMFSFNRGKPIRYWIYLASNDWVKRIARNRDRECTSESSRIKWSLKWL